MTPQTLHADAVAVRTAQGWRGVLITGASGAGKSDLALRLMTRGWRLVSDDYSHVWASGGGVWATAPGRIAGLIEARGVGILPVPARTISRIVLVVEAVSQTPQRLPEADLTVVAGIALPRIAVDLRAASAVEIVASAIGRL